MTGPDLRLAGAALGTWGAALLGLYLPATPCVLVAALSGLTAAALAWRAGRRCPAVGAGRVGLRWPAAEVRAGGRRWSAVEAGADGRRVATVLPGHPAPSSVEPRPGAASGPHRPVKRRRAGRGGPVAWAVAAALLGVAAGSAATAARVWLRDAEPVASLAAAQATGEAELTVTGDPHLLPRSQPGPPTYLIEASLDRITTEGVTADVAARVVVFASDPAWRDLLPSQRVAARVRLARPRGGDLTSAALTATGAPRLVGTPSAPQRIAGRLRSGLQTACAPLPAAPGGLLPGLVVGDTSRLDQALADDFRATGLTHLTAVSGANLAIVLSVVLFAARWCRAGPWLGAGLCAVALVGFVILARPSPSVLRAAAMGSVALLALASARERAAPPALAGATMACLLVDPALAADAGFALSVLATGALVLLAPRWRDALVARGVPHGVAEAVAIPAAAQVACGPLIVALSGQISIVAVPANLLAAPAVAPATLLGVGATVVFPLWPDAAAFLAWCASWPARYLAGIASIGAGIPDGSIPWPAGGFGGLALGAVTVALVVAARRPVARRLVVVAALAVAVGAVPVRWIASGWPPAGAVVVACDVGQGDAIVLPTGGSEGIVVDAGPDPEVVDGCLRRLGIRAVVAVIVTHYHADHVGGIAGVLRGRPTGAVLLPEHAEPVEGVRLVRGAAAAAGVPTATVGPGWTLARGSVLLRAIGPRRPESGTRSDPNNNSVLLRADSSGVSILLLGDAETEEQRTLLSEVDPAQLRVDVVKVAHHGSAFQDPELLAALRARVALVSVGAGNSYGHPNPSVLDRLRRGGASVLRTDLAGDLAVVRSDHGIGVVTRSAAGNATGGRGRVFWGDNGLLEVVGNEDGASTLVVPTVTMRR